MAYRQLIKQAFCKTFASSPACKRTPTSSPHLFNPSFFAGDAINNALWRSSKSSTQVVYDEPLSEGRSHVDGASCNMKYPLESIRDDLRNEMERRRLLLHLAGTSSSAPASSAAASSKIALLGGPGVGKGTWGSLLAQRLSIPHISTGDLVRKELSKPSSASPNSATEMMLHEQVKSAVSEGKLLPDRVVLDLLLARLQTADPSAGFILDGFPRTIAQAAMLEEAVGGIDLALNFQMDNDVLVAKCLGRRTCKHCGKDYNLSHIDPLRTQAQIDNFDSQHRHDARRLTGRGLSEYRPDVGLLKTRRIFLPARLPPPECASHLSVRADDSNEAAVRERLRLHASESKPLIQHYLSQRKLVDVNVGSGAASVWSSLLNIVGT
ncbi:hypothetical protein L7F22_056586 [Adiantum nelumboides]|nr:hypothetical protein [Adiantum nelumboides]